MEKDFIAEKRAAAKELEEKMVELKENLIQDMEEKRKIIESERVSMELSGVFIVSTECDMGIP
jgi:Sin3 histone deacetylase corepressor complex component SDS3